MAGQVAPQLRLGGCLCFVLLCFLDEGQVRPTSLGIVVYRDFAKKETLENSLCVRPHRGTCCSTSRFTHCSLSRSLYNSERTRGNGAVRIQSEYEGIPDSKYQLNTLLALAAV